MRALRAEVLPLPVAAAVACVVLLLRKRKLPFAVSDSSRSIAALRALESEKDEDDALFNDPFAAKLAGEAALARVCARGAKGDNGRIAIRTKFFDDAVVHALGDGTEQVVLLGAGLDTRAWRLAPPKGSEKAAAVFEVDVPEVLNGKETVLRDAPLTLSNKYCAVKSNLNRKGWHASLLKAGFDKQKKTIWVTEGLLYYLAPNVVRDVLVGTYELSPMGSRLVSSVVNHASYKRASKPGSKGAKATWKSWSNMPERDFLRYGWRGQTIMQPGESGANYGRWRGEVPPPRAIPSKAQGEELEETPRTFYVVCTRLDER